MAYLIDTNILARLANIADAQHAVVARAVVELHRRGEVLHVTPQVLIEFRSMATRPKAENGLGLSAVDAERRPRVSRRRFLFCGHRGHLSCLEGSRCCAGRNREASP